MTTTERISPHEAYALVRLGQKVIFLDSRNPKAWFGAEKVRNHAKMVGERSSLLAQGTNVLEASRTSAISA